MFDVWIGDVELTTLVIIVAIVAVLPIQLLLCFKVKNLLLKLLPSILFAVVTISFFTMIFSSQDWDSIGYAILAMLAGILLLMSGVAWGIWGIVVCVRKNKKKKESK